MSSAIAKLILKMMPLASVLGFGTSLCLIKEHLYYPPSPRRLGRHGQRHAAASVAPVVAWSQRGAPRECLRPCSAWRRWSTLSGDRVPDRAEDGLGESHRSQTPQFGNFPPGRLSHYIGAPPPPNAGLFSGILSHRRPARPGEPPDARPHTGANRRGEHRHPTVPVPTDAARHRALPRHSLPPIASHFCAPRG